ncbi:MAG: ABC transporter permease subunit [Actinomycetota bacterium]
MTVEAPPRGIDVLELEKLPAPRSPKKRRRPATARRFWMTAVVVAVVASALSLGVGRQELLNSGGWPMVRRFFAAALNPVLTPEFLRLTWDASLTTVAYASVGTALSVAFGLVFGVLVSQTWWGLDSGGRRTLWSRGGWLGARGLLGLPRGVHEVVWGLFLVSVLGLDPLVGVLAIGIPFGAVTAKVFSELLDEAPGHAFRALRASGAGRIKAFAYALGPEAFPDLLSYSFYRFECAVRAAAILGLIGAGGLGYQISLSFYSLNYEEVWTLIYALVIISGLVDLWSTLLRRPNRNRFRVRPQGECGSGPAMQRDRFVNLSLAGFVLLVGVCTWHLGLSISNLWSPRTRGLLGDIAVQAFPPDFSAAALSSLWGLSLETVAMSVVAIALSTVLSVGMAFVAARTVGDAGAGHGSAAALAALASRAVLLFFRAIPPPVWALVVLFVFLPGPLPGAIALGLYNFGILGRLMAEVVENLDSRPVKALQAQGTVGARSFAYGVLPLTLPRFGGFSLYRWEVTMREVVVVGVVGAGGLGRLLSAQLNAFDYRGLVSTLLALVALTLFADVVGASVRRAIR